MSELRMYDVAIDEHRAPTQKDIDEMQLLVQCFGAMREIMRQIIISKPHDLKDHLNLLARMRDAA